MVKYLHDRGAHMESKCKNGWTAAVGAAYFKEIGLCSSSLLDPYSLAIG
jgi:hypothetical protein